MCRLAAAWMLRSRARRKALTTITAEKGHLNFMTSRTRREGLRPARRHQHSPRTPHGGGTRVPSMPSTSSAYLATPFLRSVSAQTASNNGLERCRKAQPDQPCANFDDILCDDPNRNFVSAIHGFVRGLGGLVEQRWPHTYHEAGVNPDSTMVTHLSWPGS